MQVSEVSQLAWVHLFFYKNTLISNNRAPNGRIDYCEESYLCFDSASSSESFDDDREEGEESP